MKKVKFITAGAGSGKTYRLTTDMVSSIKSGVKPSEIILTTYTKAAATEFRQKAIEALVKSGLTNEAMQMAGAKIGTIDSVCQSFVEKYWYLLGISPSLNVIASSEEQVFVNQSMEGVISEADLQLFDKVFQMFSIKKSENNISVDDPEFWKDDLSRIVDLIRNYGISNYSESKKESCDLVDAVFNGPNVDWNYLNGFLGNSDSQRLSISRAGGNITFKPEDKKPEVENLKKEEDSYHKLVEAISLFSNLMKDSKKQDYPFEDEMAQIKESRGRTAIPISWRTFISKCNGYLLSIDFADILKAYIDRIFDLATRWKVKYEETKASHGLIDYNDMESMFLSLLDNPIVADSIRVDYKLIMVDEFQDCNPLQLEIFSKLSDILASREDGCGQTVWVGDKKQSIYGFRGSDMELIDAVTDKFPLPKAAADADGLEMDSLPDSYRSRKKLVEAANELFSPIFGASEELNPKRVYNGDDDMPEVPALVDWQTAASNKGNYYKSLAVKIKELIDGKDAVVNRVVEYEHTKEGYRQKELRAVKPEDIAVLVRYNEDVPGIVESLNAAGIMVSVAEQELKEFVEIRLMLAILSYSIGKSDYDRASILHLLDGKSVPDIIEEKLEGGFKDNGLLQTLDDILEKTKGQSLSQLVETVIVEYNIWARVEQWGEGARRRAHISSFVKIVAAYEEHTRLLGLAPSALGFLNYFDSYEMDKEPFAKIEGAVGVLTYHQSKGLEWPVVIMCQLESDNLNEEKLVKRNLIGVQHHPTHKDKIERAARAEVITLLPKIVSGNSKIPDPFADVMLPMVASNTDIYNRVKQEDSRLLYVAFTRARDYVITTKYSRDYLWLENVGVLDSENVWKTNERTEMVGFDEVPEYPDVAERMYRKIRFQQEDSFEPTSKYIVPSSLRQKDMKCEVKVTSEVNLKSGFSIDLDNNTMRVVGSCIHDIYASYDASANRETSVLKARTILKAHGLAEYEGKADSIIKAIETLYEHLTKTYGPAKSISHELPILVRSAEGQVMTGSIDLLWETEGGCVVVDFKHKEHDEDLPSSARGYAPQLSAYREALELANQNVDAMVLFYPLQSVVMELK